MSSALRKIGMLAAPLLRACGFVHRDSAEARSLMREGAWEAALKRSAVATRSLTHGAYGRYSPREPIDNLPRAAREAIRRLRSTFEDWKALEEETPPHLRIEIHRCMAETCEYALAMAEDRTLTTDEACASMEKVATQLTDVIQRAGTTRSSRSLTDFTLGLEALDRQLPAEARS